MPDVQLIKTSIKIEKPFLRNTIFKEMLNKNNYYSDKPLLFTSLTAGAQSKPCHTFIECLSGQGLAICRSQGGGGKVYQIQKSGIPLG